MALAMKGLIDHAASHEHQIALLWQAIETLSRQRAEGPVADCMPADAQRAEHFDAARLSQMVK